MLYRIPYADKDKDFQMYLDAITKLNWPKAIFSGVAHVKALPGSFKNNETDDKRLVSIKEALKKIAN